jgi:hypothetical protein
MPMNRHPTPIPYMIRLRSILDGCGSMDGRLNLTNRSPHTGHLLPFSVKDTFPHAHLKIDLMTPSFFDRFEPGAPVSRAGFFAHLHDLTARRVVFFAVLANFRVNFFHF